ncbi:hypothetical protein [Methylobacterium pseudosasicola]|uniref:Uncharacterized protein n=1 Tax=Methylobacterium pseudosasicola TaxID=582667 RepID=A0A1I4MNY2_9HYPH|nr:hypothetical protein [Methylobacterium pseudosasicola]SFM04766.1 hypothetical protein SAMN05192568_101796 [Methylobacterium pseudosasicola]
MKALIQDAVAINSIKPLNVIGYLRSHGWSKFSEVHGKFSVWDNPAFPDNEVVVPLRREASDFIIRLGDILKELSAAEGRSQLEVLRDLINSGFDVIRLGVRSPNTDSGTVRIEDGVRLFEQTREMLLAAACSTVRPRAVFHSRKPQQALEYMNGARLGQTEHGSFILTVLSPVAPQLNPFSETDLFPEEPFERQVVKTLALGVQTTVTAAEQSALATEDNFRPFQEAVNLGVSANLCEGIVGLFRFGDQASISLSVAWAQNRPMPEAVPSRTVITSDVIPTITEAARIFRARDALEDYQVTGPVVKLERADGQEAGRVTIYALIEGVMRKVNVTLLPTEYAQATRAHEEYKSVKLIGTVVREGRSYRVNNPTGFSFASDEDE